LAEEFLHQPDDGGLRDFEELTLARILFSRGDRAQALDRLATLSSRTKSAGRIASLIEALVVSSKILKAAGDQDAALETIAAAVELAQPEEFVRVFINEGEEIAALIALLQKTRLPVKVAGFLSKLLKHWGASQFDGSPLDAGGIQPAQGRSPALSNDSLVEPLSPRELEVLGLIAEGFSNPEVAARLYLSVNTLRAHTTNIYQKLDVHSRLQAVTRARELGLLE
jgi:LuxR family maltose regulon positive regulatory protein